MDCRQRLSGGTYQPADVVQISIHSRWPALNLSGIAG